MRSETIELRLLRCVSYSPHKWQPPPLRNPELPTQPPLLCIDHRAESESLTGH